MAVQIYSAFDLGVLVIGTGIMMHTILMTVDREGIVYALPPSAIVGR